MSDAKLDWWNLLARNVFYRVPNAPLPVWHTYSLSIVPVLNSWMMGVYEVGFYHKQAVNRDRK